MDKLFSDLFSSENYELSWYFITMHYEKDVHMKNLTAVCYSMTKNE